MMKHLMSRAHPRADEATLFVTHAHQDVPFEIVRTYIEIGEGGYGTVLALAWSPDGRFWASAGADDILRIWEASTNHQIQLYPLNQHGGKVLDVMWSPDSTSLAILAAGGIGHHGSAREMRVLMVETGKEIYHAGCVGNELRWSAREPIGPISTDSFAVVECDPTRVWSPDARYFVAGGAACGQGRIRHEKTAPVTPPNESMGEGSRAGGGNGHHTIGGPVQLVDRASQQVKLRLPRGTSLVAWSPAGSWIASAQHKTISLWDVDAGALRYTYRGHMGWWSHVTCLSWAPSGREIASGDSIGTIHIWRVQALNDQ